MANEKLKRLIDRLWRRTEEGAVAWEETTNEQQFQAVFPKYTLRLTGLKSDPGIGPPQDVDFTVTIHNDEGAVIEEFTDVQLDRDENGHPYFSKLRDTFEMARRTAMGVEEALEHILKELDSDDLPF